MGALSRQFPFSAHRRRDPGGGERLPARLARILARMLDAPVRMTDQAGSWALPPDGHLEGFHRDPGRASRLAHGPADDLAGVRGARTAARRERGPWPRWGRASPVNQPLARAHAEPAPAKAGAVQGSDPRAGPGWAAPPRSCARSGGERWGAHAGPRWCARGRGRDARPRRPARRDPGGPPGGARRGGRGCAGRRGRAALRSCPRSPRGPGGRRREAPGWPGSSRFRAGCAMREWPLTDTPSTRRMMEIGQMFLCSSQRPKPHRVAASLGRARPCARCRAPSRAGRPRA